MIENNLLYNIRMFHKRALGKTESRALISVGGLKSIDPAPLFLFFGGMKSFANEARQDDRDER